MRPDSNYCATRHDRNELNDVIARYNLFQFTHNCQLMGSNPKIESSHCPFDRFTRSDGNRFLAYKKYILKYQTRPSKGWIKRSTLATSQCAASWWLFRHLNASLKFSLAHVADDDSIVNEIIFVVIFDWERFNPFILFRSALWIELMARDIAWMRNGALMH